MNVQDAIKRAEYLIEDEFIVADALSLIQDCLDDLSNEAPYENRATLVVNYMTGSVSLPTDLVSISAVYYGNKKLELIDDLGTFDESLEGTEPEYYYPLAGKLLLYPLVKGAYSVKLMYQAGYGTISSVSDDLPSSLPPRFHKAVVWYLVMQYRVMDEEIEEVQLLSLEYYKYRASLKLYWENLKENYYTPPVS